MMTTRTFASAIVGALTSSVFPQVASLIGGIAAVWRILLATLKAFGRWRLRRLLQAQTGSRLFPASVLREATRFYVQPDCSNVDQSQEAELRHAVVVKEPVFKKVDAYLLGPDQYRYLLVLADSGMGKTAFALNYYARKPARTHEGCFRVAVVPLGHPKADDEIRDLKRQSETILVLDAFDEDSRAISDFRARLIDLMQLCANFRKVVITCRTQFFPKDAEIPVRTGVLRLGPRRAGETHEYEFWKLYLCAFSDAQVSAFLRMRFPWWQLPNRLRARRLVKKIPLLAVRPMLLAHVPDLLSKAIPVDYSFELYEQMIEAWLRREASWIQESVLRRISERLAVDLFANRDVRGGEHIPIEDLRALTFEVPVDEWKLSNRSLLNRDALGNYKFAHRSIMEYLLVRCALQGNQLVQKWPWTDQMTLFFGEIIFALLRSEWGRIGNHQRSTGQPWLAEQRSGTEQTAIEGWEWSSAEPRVRLPTVLNLSEWLVHYAGIVERAPWTREQREVDAEIRSLRVSIDSAKQLCIQFRGESTLEFKLLEGAKGKLRVYGFVFDVLSPDGAITLFTGEPGSAAS